MNRQLWRRIARLVLPLLVGQILATPVHAYRIPIKGYPKLDINGSNVTSLNMSAVKGSQSLYTSTTYGSTKVLTNDSSLSMTGELFKNLFFTGSLSAGQYSSTRTNWNLRYENKLAQVLLGQFSASMGGNQFVTLNRSLTGIQVDAHLPKRGSALKFLTSTLRAPVRTDTFYGQNITGPYYLTSSPIINESEVVTVNNQPMRRGTDYVLDYRNGILNFAATLIITSDDRVVVSYEVDTGSGGHGQLYGVHAAYPVAKGVDVGVTHLRIDGRAGAASQNTVTDTFKAGSFQYIFVLTNRPIDRDAPVTVTINDVPATETTDYTVAYDVGEIRFVTGRQPVINDTVKIRYTYTIPASGSGDQAVTGVNIGWTSPFGLTMRLDAAGSTAPKPAADGTPAPKGATTAYALNADFRRSRLSASANYRKVEPGFSPLESIGYRNVQNTLDWRMGYQFTDWLDFTMSGNDAKEPYDAYAVSQQPRNSVWNRNRSYVLNLQPKGLPALTLQHDTTKRTGVGSDLDDASSSDMLFMNWSRGPFSTNSTLTRSTKSSRRPQGTSGEFYTYRGTTEALSASLTYQPSSRFSLGTNYASSRLFSNNNGQQELSGSRNLQGNFRYQVTNALALNGGLQSNRADDAITPTGEQIPGLVSTNSNLGLTWTPSDRVSLTTNFSNDSSEGGVFDTGGSKSQVLSAEVAYHPSARFSSSAYWYRQHMRYSTDAQSSVSNMVGANAQIGVLKKASLNIEGQHLWGKYPAQVTRLAQLSTTRQTPVTLPISAAGTDFAPSGNQQTALRASIAYPLSRRQNLSLGAESTWDSASGQDSRTHALSLGWNYLISNELSLVISAGRNYGRRIYTDGTAPSTYQADKLNAQLSFNF